MDILDTLIKLYNVFVNGCDRDIMYTYFIHFSMAYQSTENFLQEKIYIEHFSNFF